MSKLSDRDRLLRLVKGENLDDSVCYYIEYSLDIRGKVTIWGGMSFLREERVPMIDDPKKRVSRVLVPIYDYHICSPYTLRVYQMEQDIDETLTDEYIVGEYEKFREGHQEDGFGFRLSLLQLPFCVPGSLTEDEEGLMKLRRDRDDKQEVLNRLLTQERKDIRTLWGVDCPPNINDGPNYGQRLMNGQGMSSGWFREEFERIGGDWNKHLTRE